jgi:hypothetical protein
LKRKHALTCELPSVLPCALHCASRRSLNMRVLGLYVVGHTQQKHAFKSRRSTFVELTQIASGVRARSLSGARQFSQRAKSARDSAKTRRGPPTPQCATFEVDAGGDEALAGVSSEVSNTTRRAMEQHHVPLARVSGATLTAVRARACAGGGGVAGGGGDGASSFRPSDETRDRDSDVSAGDSSGASAGAREISHGGA